MIKVLAISGSTRERSTNLNLINAIEELFQDKIKIEKYLDIAGLPHFNPDHDTNHVFEKVREFRSKIKESDGVLICTPEYAMGVPGTLKNAIDWTVSSCEFLNKPTVLITASSMGEKGHQSLLATLKIIESKISNETQLLISFVKSKVSHENKITDEKTKSQVVEVMEAFIAAIETINN